MKTACTTGLDQHICTKIPRCKNKSTQGTWYWYTHTCSHLWKTDLLRWFLFLKSLVKWKYVGEVTVLLLLPPVWVVRKTVSHLPVTKLKICDCVHNSHTSINFHGNICCLNITQTVHGLMTVCSCSQNFKVSARSRCTLLKKPVINFTNVFHHVVFFCTYWWLFWSRKRLAEHIYLIHWLLLNLLSS